MIKLLLNIAKVIHYLCAICKDYVSIYKILFIYIRISLNVIRKKDKYFENIIL